MSTIGIVESGTIDVGEVKVYDLAIPQAGKYVLEIGGPAQVRVGIFQGMVAPGAGKLKVCGAGAWGCRLLDESPHVVQCTGLGIGGFTFLVRRWVWSDYFQFPFLFFWGEKHPSSCV